VDGKAGSVDDELAIVHLLRHAAAPDALGDDALEQIWADVHAEIVPAPWWKKLLDWRVAGPALAVAAAAVVIVVVWPEPKPDPTLPEVATNVPAASTADLLATQFEILAPTAREDIARTVDDGRGALRDDLLAFAVGEGKTAGGAP
jgi:hypothetical protein